ncbi:NAD(P)/FAD-dependent oxidoreductase [Sphingobium sp. BS19]|uniref:flavin-containing monooxygenase n=1 Tax=Sphingobium sp. BS19 TaxID=3018973 RepID=UPI0022EE1221|nr:NAD(P)/FAD-dependent oxidoreductase [Sphingobium sp. BS19]GLI96681.1 flavin-binding family monooxygenase [Sphingobium sp. BS19]
METRGYTTAAEHVDVIIVGAGISGVGSAYRLQQDCPEKTYLVLEGKDTFGGTWETHKYPGVRSDSDLYTFGYSFRPWLGNPIASAEDILAYMGTVIEENGIGPRIRYGHWITACSFSRETDLWTVEATRKSDGAKLVFTCNFLWMCQGYYDHETPHIPDWAGMADYKGLFVHAQKWDPATDYTGKRVLVIGSGATAATVVPAFAEKAAHVVMLQRSPTYFLCRPNQNDLADRLREIGMDEPTIHRVARTQILHDQLNFINRCNADSNEVFEELKTNIRAFAGEDFPIEPHFVPKYKVWQQRIAFCPNGDLFQAAAAGKVSVVTDTIDRFTEKGVRTASGEEIEADIIVACTGFNLLVMGGIPFTVDGKPIDWHETVTYRGAMFTGVPNMVWVMGYFRASWTLRVEMISEFVCKLLNRMSERKATRVEVTYRPQDESMALADWIEEDNFNPGYLMRGLKDLPRRGDQPEWRHNQDYWAERHELPNIDLDGPEFLYDGQRTNSEPLVAI